MKTSRVLVLILSIVVWIVPLARGADQKVVATLGEAAITAADLDRAVGNRLMRARTDEYNIRRAVLDELVANKLLAAEAKRRGMTVDDLLKQEVDAKVVVPALADIEPFYEATKERYGNVAKDDAIRQIFESMQRQKSAARRADFVRQLREAAHVRVALDPPRIELPVTGPTRGKAGAPVTIVEYSDFECPFCGRATSTMRKVLDQYSGSVQVIYRDFPLPSHRGAARAAEAAHCAGDQGKYWEMNDRLFAKGGAITDGDIRKAALELQLDEKELAACLDSGKHTATWKASQAEGESAGVQSTPTFFINGRMIAGAAPYEMFAQVIDDELTRAGIRRETGAPSAAATTAERRTP